MSFKVLYAVRSFAIVSQPEHYRPAEGEPLIIGTDGPDGEHIIWAQVSATGPFGRIVTPYGEIDLGANYELQPGESVSIDPPVWSTP